VKEEEIRPRAIFDEYLRLAATDTRVYFEGVAQKAIPCPACGQPGRPEFEKEGFTYEECPGCQTLFVNPRPEARAFERYYRESPSSRFWATTFYKDTAEARREKLWKPKARAIAKILERFTGSPLVPLVDIGGGYGLFAEEMERVTGLKPWILEPAPHLAAVCREKGFPVVEKFLESVAPADLPPGPKAFVSFELFEHLHDPSLFLERLRGFMAFGDLFIFTTLSGTGLDIRSLWESSKSASPPHHLNLLNPRSVSVLLARSGFETLEVTTPGKLDLSILDNNREKIRDRFWKTFLEVATQEAKQKMQECIASLGMSSHMWVVCRKNRSV
jgi:uncharacterized Zn finger protein (UPF0148 family)